MKAMILAAGLGLRLRPLTLTTPKPLVKVKGHALIDYHFFALKKAQINEVVINVHHLGDQIIDHIEQHWGYEFNLHFFKEEEILGTGGGIYQAISVFDDNPFLVLSADIFTDYPYEQLPQKLNDGQAYLVMVDNPSFHPKGDFCLNSQGLITLDQGERLTYGNIGIYHPSLFASSTVQKFEIRDILLPAITQGLIHGEHYKGSWANIGTLEQLESLS